MVYDLGRDCGVERVVVVARSEDVRLCALQGVSGG